MAVVRHVPGDVLVNQGSTYSTMCLLCDLWLAVWLQEGSVARTISGCVSLLMVVQASAKQSTPRETILGSLDKAMALLKPQHPRNSPLLSGLQRSVQTLTQQLTAC